MSKRDYYEVLGLSKGASKDEIKKRIVVWLKIPSDVSKEENAIEKFKVQEAYEVLSDDQSVRNMIDLVMLVQIKVSVALAAAGLRWWLRF